MERIIQQQKRLRWIYLAVSVLLLLCLGLIYAWSVFRVPLEQEFGWAKSDSSLTFSISMMMFCLGGLASGILTAKKGVRLTLILCAVFLTAGFILASRVEALWELYLTYGVLAGFGSGLGYNAAISTSVRWFPDKQGLVSGIALMGFGFGAMILGTLGASLITLLGWRLTFFLFGAAFAVVILAAAAVLRPPQHDFLTALSGTLKKDTRSLEEINWRQMLHRRNFWLYFFWAILLSAAGLAVINISTAYAADFLGGDLTRAAAVAGIVSVANGIGRVGFGQLFDSKGYRTTMLSVCFVYLLAAAALLVSDASHSLSILAAAFVLIGLAYGGVTPTNSAYTAFFFGKKNYGLNFSITNLNLIPASYLGPLCACGEPVTVFLLIAVLAFLGAGITVVIRSRRQQLEAVEM